MMCGVWLMLMSKVMKCSSTNWVQWWRGTGNRVWWRLLWFWWVHPSPPTEQPGHEKRAILEFLGPLISWLLGTPSEASWKLVQRNLRTFHPTTEALQSSLGQTLQIVNVTNRNVVMNRAAIVDLASDLRHTRTGVNEILTWLQDKVENHFRPLCWYE